MSDISFQIRSAQPVEFRSIGQLMVRVYAQLEGFPSPMEQPKYYEKLENIGILAEKTSARLLVAVTNEEEIVGAVIYFGDMKEYGSGGKATLVKNAGGFRLLAVDSKMRGLGLGKRLTQACIDLAKDAKKNHMVIHSTKAMKQAWKMYEKMGFRRATDLDFMQEKLPVFGFRLEL